MEIENNLMSSSSAKDENINNINNLNNITNSNKNSGPSSSLVKEENIRNNNGIISNNPRPHVVKEENISNNLRPVKEETNNNFKPVKKEENNADSGDWRAETTMEYRQRLRNSILESRLWIFPNIAPEKMNDMKQTVEEFEERCFSNCTTKEDYINRLQSTITIRDINLHTIVEAKATPSASSHGKRNSTNPAFQGIQSQQCNERKPLPTSLPKSMPYLPQQQPVPSHSMQNTIASAGVQSTSLPSPLSYGTSLMDTTVSNGAGQSCNMLQSLTGYSTGQCAPSNIFASSHKMQVRQNANPMVVQQQSQNAHQFIYPQQLQNQIAKQMPYGSSIIQPQINHNYQQLHQQTIQQTSQLQSSQQAFIQAPPSLHSSRPSPHQTTRSFAQSSTNSVHQQNQQTSIQMRPNVLQQNSQFIRQQQQLQVQQQKTLLGQQSKLSSHQNQHLTGNGPDEMNIPSELLGEHCNIADLQQLQLQQQQETEWCLGGEQSNQSRMQQQIMNNQNVISNFHEQQLGGQCNVSGFHQKNKQISSRMSGSPQQPTMSQPQMRPAQLQKQNSLQRDTPHKLHSSCALLQPQNATEQQKQLFQLQNMPPEASSDSVAPTRQTSVVNDELFHKIREMNELYLPSLLDIYKVVTKLIQNGKPDHTDSTKTKNFKSWLEHVINVLQNPEGCASSEWKDRIMHMERNIIANVKMHRKFQQRQSGDHSPRAQMTQLQHQYSQISTQMQPRNSKLSVVSMQQAAVSNMQHDLPTSLSTQFGMPVVQPSMINTLQPSHNMEISHGNGQSSFQQGVVQSPQKFIHNATQDMRLNVTSQNDRLLHPNMDKHPKMQDQQMIKTQKQQFQQHQMSRQEQQIMLQQLQQHQHQQQQQQQQYARQIPPSYQLDEITNLKGKQGMTAKLGVLHQQHTAAQHFAYHHQPLKAGVSFRVSSPLSIQAGSPQVSQISSPQTDQQSMMTTGSKAGTPLQLSNSLLVTPSPSTPHTPSTVPVELEKQSSGVSQNAANSGQIQPVTALHQSQSLVIDTPGISTSPLLSPEDDPGTAPAIICSKSSATQRSIERLINAVKSISQKSLSASVNDISSVVSLVDKLGGSGHGPGHRACVGDDLVARAKQNVLEKVISEDEIVMTKRKTFHSDFIFQNTLFAADSFIDNFKQLNGLETSDLESTETSRIKRPRCEVTNALVEEIQQINRHLINTKVDICDEDARLAAPIDEDGEGTVVKCSFTALGVQLPVLSVCLLVPANYPNCSPALLDKMPLELSTVAEDLLVKATSCFNRSLCCLPQPMTLGEMANTWDACARAVIMEYAEQNGGGSFSKRYGTWQHCVSAN